MYISIGLLGLLAFVYILPFHSINDPRPYLRTIAYSCIFFSGITFVLYKSQSNFYHSLFRKPLKDSVFLIASAILYSLHYLFLLYNHQNSFYIGDFDFVAMADVIQNTLNGHFFRTTYYGKETIANYLSHHFSPSILLLSPFLYLTENRLGYGFGLLFFNLLGLFFVKKILDKFKIHQIHFQFILVQVLLNLYVYRVFQSYHFELLIIPLTLFLYFSVIHQNWLGVFLSLFLALLLKEDMAIYLICLGLFLIAEKRFRFGLFISIVSVLYFVFFVPKLQQLAGMSARVDWLKEWSQWGQSYIEIIWTILSSPIQIIGLYFKNLNHIWDLLLSFGLILLLRPTLLLFALPILLLHFLSARIWYNTLFNYYSYSVLPILLIGFLVANQHVETFFKRWNIPKMVVLFFAMGLVLIRSSNDIQFPYSIKPVVSQRLELIKDMIDQIPVDACVQSQFDLSLFVSRKNPLYPIRDEIFFCDYVLIDKNGFSPYINIDKIFFLADELVSQKKYTNVFNSSEIRLLRKVRGF